MLTIDLESTFAVKSLLIEKNNLNPKYSRLIKLDTIILVLPHLTFLPLTCIYCIHLKTDTSKCRTVRLIGRY